MEKSGKKVLIGDPLIKETSTSFDTIGRTIVEGILQAIKDTGKWERYSLKLEFKAKKDGDEIRIDNFVLRGSEVNSEEVEEEVPKPSPEFMKELKKL